MGHCFTLFPQLPTELRLEIWRHCAPSTRVTELGWSIYAGDCDLLAISLRNSRQPVFGQTCREARRVAFEMGGFLAPPSPSASPATACWPVLPRGIAGHTTWFCLDSDVVHLNLDERFMMPGELEDSGKILNAYRPIARHLSFSAEAACLPFNWHNFHRLQRPRADDPAYAFKAGLEPRREYLACIAEIVVHASANAVRAEGVFEAPIQILDPFVDQEAIAAMYRLWQPGQTYNETEREAQVAMFASMMNLDVFRLLTARWHHVNKTRWLAHVWTHEVETGALAEVNEAAKIWKWRDPAETGYPFQMPPDQDSVWLRLYRFNPSHPWVIRKRDTMPIFLPRILFRHCDKGCFEENECKK